ncbi:unnamed protein product [Symbiodinium necroappetens]|uniref:Uncharacterized protein n=1 Tax=Symbiodinium necroappetens TaxID=1628268 RepID=A0A813A7B2_9DINO|nr:unnamed protein product [Symbiodinium necroappetens]
METVNFLIHVLGVDSQQNLARDPLLQDLVRGAQFSERERKQSRVLSVKEIATLEEVLAGHSLNKIDRFAVGVFLFQVYSWARVSDIRSITKFEIDMIGSQGYLEARTTDHKNRRKDAGLDMSLCLVAPANGLEKKPWALSFLEAAPDIKDFFSRGSPSATSGRILAWLNRVLEPPLLEEALPSFSFQASSGVPGGHQGSTDESGADWGRDQEEVECSEMAADSCLASGLGSWSECDPPLSDEGFRHELGSAQGQPSEALNDPEDSSESDSSGEDTADDEDRKYEVLSSAPEIEKLAPQVEFGVDLDVYQNPRTLSLHGRAKGSSGPLICGRSVSGMKLFVGRVHSKTWRCKQCMAGRPIRDSGAAANFINSRLGSRQR